jgi:hypothetical protein
MAFSDQMLPDAERAVGLPLATALVTDSAAERKLIITALLGGATVFLLHRYFDGFLKGAGFDDLSERHGKAAATLMTALREGKDIDAAVATAKASLDQSVAELVRKKVDLAAREDAIAVVADLLKSRGAPAMQADDVARALAAQVAAAGSSSPPRELRGP